MRLDVEDRAGNFYLESLNFEAPGSLSQVLQLKEVTYSVGARR